MRITSPQPLSLKRRGTLEAKIPLLKKDRDTKH